jgi:hypothetical protein
MKDFFLKNEKHQATYSRSHKNTTQDKSEGNLMKKKDKANG